MQWRCVHGFRAEDGGAAPSPGVSASQCRDPRGLAVPAVTALERASTAQVRDGLIARGGVSAADLDRFLELLDTGAMYLGAR